MRRAQKGPHKAGRGSLVLFMLQFNFYTVMWGIDN
jgi:hypothetical protein